MRIQKGSLQLKNGDFLANQCRFSQVLLKTNEVNLSTSLWKPTPSYRTINTLHRNTGSAPDNNWKLICAVNNIHKNQRRYDKIYMLVIARIPNLVEGNSLTQAYQAIDLVENIIAI